jgi:hypothetical protein
MPDSMKPQECEESYTVMGNTPYAMEGDTLMGTTTMDGGVLGRGQIVWMRKRLGKQSLHPLVSAYAEKLGLISLDPRFLIATAELVLPSFGNPKDKLVGPTHPVRRTSIALSYVQKLNLEEFRHGDNHSSLPAACHV